MRAFIITIIIFFFPQQILLRYLFDLFVFFYAFNVNHDFFHKRFKRNCLYLVFIFFL